MRWIDGVVEAEVSLAAYRVTAVKKAAYRMARRCTVVLGEPATSSLPLTFRFRPDITSQEALEIARAFFAELLDQELREQVAEETAPLRTLILAAAFSRVDLLQREPRIEEQAGRSLDQGE